MTKSSTRARLAETRQRLDAGYKVAELAWLKNNLKKKANKRPACTRLADCCKACKKFRAAKRAYHAQCDYHATFFHMSRTVQYRSVKLYDSLRAQAELRKGCTLLATCCDKCAELDAALKASVVCEQ
jgi:hypothetical protein